MRISNHLSRAVASVMAVAAVATFSAFPALAGPATESVDSQRAVLIQHLQDSGVPEAKQQSLADKIEGGEPLAADSSTAVPVSETTTVEDGFTVIRKDYSDGSFTESSVEIAQPAPAPGTITPLAISGCGSTVGSGYVKKTNCLVKANASTFSVNFRADYVHSGGKFGEISRVWDANVQVYFGTYSNKSLKITRKVQSGNSPAEARLQWMYTAWGGVAQGDTMVYLRVTGTKASTVVN